MNFAFAGSHCSVQLSCLEGPGHIREGNADGHKPHPPGMKQKHASLGTPVTGLNVCLQLPLNQAETQRRVELGKQKTAEKDHGVRIFYLQKNRTQAPLSSGVLMGQ